MAKKKFPDLLKILLVFIGIILLLLAVKMIFKVN